MRKTLLAIALTVSPCAHSIDKWRTEDTAREALYMTLHLIDWGQTLYISDHPWRHSESNIILGPYPSNSEVNRYFAATALMHIGISYVLPHKYREVWQHITIGIQARAITHNAMVGVKIDF